MKLFRRTSNTKQNNQSPTAFQKYELMIKARNFHYENYNKWMSYFYLMTAALFVAYYTIANNYLKESTLNSDKEIDLKVYMIGVASLGIIISFFWYLANKGYYYWNINFITLVNHYEKSILKFPEEERVYFVAANRNAENFPYHPFRGANYSTSKISIFISYIFIYVWCLILNYNLLKFLSCNNIFTYIMAIISPIIYILLLTVIFSKYFKSHNKHFPDLKIETPDSNNYQPTQRY